MTTYSEKSYREKIKTDVEFAFSNKKNFTPHAYIDIAGDLVSGTLLAQILYWCGENEENGKLRVFKDGHYWLAKGRNDWYDEVRITARQFDTAIAKLEARVKGADKKVTIDETKRLVEVRVFKFNGVPTTHIRPVYENINAAVEEWKNNLAKEMQEAEDKADNGCVSSISQNCDIEVTDLEVPYTENTNRDYSTETTDKDLRSVNDLSLQENTGNIYTPDSANPGEPSTDPIAPKDFSDEKELQAQVDYAVNLATDCVGYTKTMVSNDIQLLITEYNKLSVLNKIPVCKITPKSMIGIVYGYTNPPENMDDAGIDDYVAMLKEYFKTDFGAHGRYKGKITRSLEHFMSDGIRSRLYERCRQNE